jgi:hypothetical protein
MSKRVTEWKETFREGMFASPDLLEKKVHRDLLGCIVHRANRQHISPSSIPNRRQVFSLRSKSSHARAQPIRSNSLCASATNPEGCMILLEIIGLRIRAFIRAMNGGNR